MVQKLYMCYTNTNPYSLLFYIIKISVNINYFSQGFIFFRTF